MVIVLLAGLGWAVRSLLREHAVRKQTERPGGQPSGGEQPST